ncbi:CDP-diacylglycerol-serine O-phosphatidyltransferase [Elasticomyces elasticus]|nr:CDP-diacylglycerol-serine O-phosphatidyltransferase [Elasticomyces elasticus]KAK3646730.1 CDP-diacylglycerol-serine O-phosphatidyltransferase [Elasticomyces elasticus]KAK4905654.1 CDP-diacylglycerol-serine O-phosphatidyltransferase [Elasticomyces elasticus]KAK5749039.1 CDP-diacylglycerol-serine O-phosphatidyltransferase [Elasticomyces elasticus]
MSKRSGVSKEMEKEAREVVEEPKQDKQARLLNDANPGHFSLVRAYHLADLITLMNGFCGFMSIISSMRYAIAHASGSKETGYMYAALALMPLGLFFDFFDGKVARWRGKSSLMGQELDSLADLISFGVAPASCAFALGLRTPLDQFFLTCFVLSGLARLARFNVTTGNVPKDATGKAAYFEGLPIPTSLTILPVFTYWVSQGWIQQSIPFGTFGSGLLEFHPIVAVFLAHGCCMVSKTLHIPKP